MTEDTGTAEREWVVEPWDCDCEGPWAIDGFVYRNDDPLLSRRPRWPYTTRHRVFHLAPVAASVVFQPPGEADEA